MKIVFLNGPPRSGKDTIANYLYYEYDYYRTKFAKALKEGSHALLGLCEFTGDSANDLIKAPVPHDFFEQHKDVPLEEFFGMKPRDFYIAVSEKFMKPTFGKMIYGTLLVREIDGLNGEYENVAISDCGFHDEIIPVINNFPDAETILVRIHRPGFDFAKDSRSYITDPEEHGIKFSKILDFQNDGSLEDLNNWVEDHIIENVY